jgi:hypothetical protein
VTAVSCEQVAAELRAALDVYSSGRRRPKSVTVLYEFLDGATVRPFHTRILDGQTWFAEGALDYDECDLVVRTAPETIHRIMSGELAGREAVMSGTLDFRKAPSVAKLMVLRSLFAQYMKARRRAILDAECIFEEPPVQAESLPAGAQARD